MATIRLLLLFAFLGAISCAGDERSEGTVPGDCIDGADNDGDGDFDCRDLGCAGAPACEPPDASADAADASEMDASDSGADTAEDTRSDGGRDSAADAANDATGTSDISDTRMDSGPLEGACETGQCFFVFDSLDAARFTPGDRIRGFNLDDRVSDDSDPEGCFQEDRTTPAGVTGVDAQFSSIVPTFESLFDAELGEIFRESLAVGFRNTLVSLSGIDGSSDDEVRCAVTPGSFRGDGDPERSGGGTLAPGQEFGASAVVVFSSCSVDDGVLSVRMESLPVFFPFGAGVETLLVDVHLTARIAGDRLEEGLFGGAFDVGAFGDALVELPEFEDIESTTREVLSNIADLDPTEAGDCTRFSASFEFSAVTAIEVD